MSYFLKLLKIKFLLLKNWKIERFIKEANLGRRNEELRKQDKDKILFSFYKSSRNEGSEFALFTETYASLMQELSNIKMKS
jgi:predicted GNAT superfamily acetyltransferase